MRNILHILMLFFLGQVALFSQNSVGVNTTAPSTDAILDLRSPSHNQGFLVPKFTQAERIQFSPNVNSNGLLVYQTDGGLAKGFWYWSGTTWVQLIDSANVSNSIANYVNNHYVGFPKGSILSWTGTLATIPIGWKLCDGTGIGVPDLTDRFILSVGSGEAPGATGGANNLTLTTDNLPRHNHSANDSTSFDGVHMHHVLSYNTAGLGCWLNCHDDIDWKAHTDHGAGIHSTTGMPEGNPDGAHTHTIAGTTSTVGQATPIDNTPPFYKVAFIIKL